MTTNMTREPPKERTIKKEDFVQLPGGKWFDKNNATLYAEWDADEWDADKERKNRIYKVGSTLVGHIWRSCSDIRGGADTTWIHEWKVIPEKEMGMYLTVLSEIPVRFLKLEDEIK